MAIKGIFGDSLPDIRWRGFRFIVTRDGISDRNRAMIFWGFYESAEIRLIEKYFDGKTDVIELGSSMGIVSTHIAKKLVAGKR